MANSAIAYPYAKALLELSVSRNELEKNRDGLAKIAKSLEDSADLRNVFANPIITEDERKKVVSAIAQQAKLTKTATHFLLLLAEKRRLAAFADIFDAFSRQADEHLGIVRAEVWSSIKLTPMQLTKLQKQLAERTGKTVELSTALDPDLIGGIRVRIEDTIIDASLATRLDQLRETILKDI